MDCGCQDSACDSRRPCAVSAGTHLGSRSQGPGDAVARGPGAHRKGGARSLPLSSLAPETAGGLWVGSAGGSLVLNLASFELEAVLRYKGEQEARQPSAASVTRVVFWLLGGSFSGRNAAIRRKDKVGESLVTVLSQGHASALLGPPAPQASLLGPLPSCPACPCPFVPSLPPGCSRGSSGRLDCERS